MSFSAVIFIDENPDDIQKCLLPENIIRERSNFNATKEGDRLKIEIEANDAVAFRATMNAITQVIAVYSKSREI